MQAVNEIEEVFVVARINKSHGDYEISVTFEEIDSFSTKQKCLEFIQENFELFINCEYTIYPQYSCRRNYYPEF